MNFKGLLFQGEYFDRNNAYCHLPEEMLYTGLPVVTFDHHNNLAQIMSKKSDNDLQYIGVNKIDEFLSVDSKYETNEYVLIEVPCAPLY